MPSENFSKTFTPALKAKADALVAKYENKKAPLLEMLHLVQEEHGFITLEAEKAVAEYLELTPIEVREVMSFYTLYYEKPRAKMRFNVCRTLSCALLGADEIVSHLEKKLGVKCGKSSADNSVSLKTVECLGACEFAPMLQLNDKDYHGNLTKEKVDELVKKGGR